MILDIWIPKLPPSSNKIYINHPQGKGRILSADARKFKIDVMNIIQTVGRVGFTNFPKNVHYQLELSMFLEAVENKKSGKGERFKQLDLSNRVKLIEDTVAEATGVDDRHNFRIVLEKHCDPDNLGVHVRLTPLPDGQLGLTKEQYETKQGKPDRAGSHVSKRLALRGSQSTGEESTDQPDPKEGQHGGLSTRPRRRRT